VGGGRARCMRIESACGAAHAGRHMRAGPRDGVRRGAAAQLSATWVAPPSPRAPSPPHPNPNPRYLDGRGNARVLLRRAGNVVRWRWGVGPGGERVPVSNARLVKWSDGSESVMLGDQVGRRGLPGGWVWGSTELGQRPRQGVQGAALHTAVSARPD
jgi:hypothetical protein